MSKISYNDPNTFEMLRKQIESEARKQLAHDITEALVDEYRISIGEKLKPLIQTITIDVIESVNSMMSVKKDFNVYVKIQETKS